MIYVCTLAIIGKIDFLEGSVPLDLPCTFPHGRFTAKISSGKLRRPDARLGYFEQIQICSDPALTAGNFCNESAVVGLTVSSVEPKTKQ